MRILLVEDSEDLGDALAVRMRSAGYAVEWVRRGDMACERAGDETFDAIVLDIQLPGKDGFSILRELRRGGRTTPVLVITARSEIDDKIGLLDLGADDYLVKPFDLREFEARLRAVMRRPSGMTASLTAVGRLTIDLASRAVAIDGQPVECGRREFRLLEVLVGRIGQVVLKERLMTQVFDLTDDVSVNALELQVSRLRRKLKGGGVEIVTVRGIGYMARLDDAA
ncbi:MAG TPA: response regulator transcription factor [Methylomirabilota bacterium]|nr:response regulator transcription factor [Methylomirabilota bacterium]